MKIKQIVEYSIASGHFPSSSLNDGRELETLQGGERTIKFNGDTITIVGKENSARTTKAELEAKNGVAQVKVALLPPFPLD